MLLVTRTSDGQKHLDLANYSFLIESLHHNKRVLFDLAFMKELDDRMPPALKALFDNENAGGIDEVHDVPDTLQTHGVELARIDSIIWSHAHIDHVGDPSVFPPTTELVVGPGFEANGLPGYPTNPDAFLLDSAFEGRNIRELDFATSTTTIGALRAIDFFGDGAFWLLETPGHTRHHISGLCRTTEDSWILLGGDVCHNAAQLRPSRSRPLHEGQGCTQVSHSSQGGPLYGLAPGMHEDIAQAKETVVKIQAFDGRDDVMVVLAHDATLLGVLDFFPQDLNGWRSKGGRRRAAGCFWKSPIKDGNGCFRGGKVIPNAVRLSPVRCEEIDSWQMLA